MKFVPMIGSPPMPMAVDCPIPRVRQLIHRFVGQRTRARDNADRSFFMNLRRHDADLALARRNNSRAIRPDQPRPAVLQEFPGRTMSSVGMPSVMQTIRSISASAASMMASAANGGGTKITEAFASGLVDRFLHGIENRPALVRACRPCPGSRRRQSACRTPRSLWHGTCLRARSVPAPSLAYFY